MMRRIHLLSCVLAVLTCTGLWAQETKYPPKGEQIPGPDKASDFQAWLTDLQHWRAERLVRIGYDGSQYGRPELKWAQSSFVQPQMMIHDRYFYDPVAGRYTVDRYLDDLDKRYGGIDSVLIWHDYPNIGIDNRNQYDLIRDLPGGLGGVKQMVADFHRRGVRVVFPVMPWDQGTCDEGVPNWTATARLLTEVGADGLNGDTLEGIPRAFFTAADQLGHPLVLEPEGGPSDEALAWNTLTWGYWQYPFVPMISRYKWLESRHMVRVCDRWNRDKTDNLQYAFFNGVGYESWENVWGIWNQITPRDAEALRRIAKIERRFADLLVSPSWEPHTPTLQYGIFASKFPGEGITLWTMVNRNEYDVVGRQIEVPYKPGTRYFDLWHGVELKPEVSGAVAILSFEMEAHGYGSILAAEEQATPAQFPEFLTEMKARARQPLRELSHDWNFLPQRVVEIPPTAPAKTAPPGMVRIPGGDFEYRVSGIEIEGRNDMGVDVQYAWENSPRRHHLRTMVLKPFYVDKYPVTNADFKKFLDATHYHPKDDHNFLRDWKNKTYPDGWANKPVTWVSLEDARVYAAWVGKRLPHEWEWQYAAQGGDGRLYPWGNDWDSSAVPSPDKRRLMREPSDVDAYPKGASPFGVIDLVGNVWQWTDEYVDEHTRAAVLRGGSYYQPQGSIWYFPQAYKLTEHGKCLLMAPGIDRAGTLGFRCVVDAQ
jgi:formylglycine-generating enzyme required for sulfatase activity